MIHSLNFGFKPLILGLKKVFKDDKKKQKEQGKKLIEKG